MPDRDDLTAEYRSGKGDVGLLKKKGYRNGSVLRVRMHNFLTFDDCEVFPGPRLNVILGPNGTGKSTVTHAICLACCGSPATVGELYLVGFIHFWFLMLRLLTLTALITSRDDDNCIIIRYPSKSFIISENK